MMEQSWIDVQRQQQARQQEGRPGPTVRAASQEDTTAAHEDTADIESAPSTASSTASLASPVPVLSVSGSTDENLKTSFNTLLQTTSDAGERRVQTGKRHIGLHEGDSDKTQADTRGQRSDSQARSATGDPETRTVSQPSFLDRFLDKLTCFSLGLLSGLVLSSLVRRFMLVR